ncbi:MAG: VanZ family protein [Rhodocyclaceae bacterium]|nr:VanZ family protein [Rhodocyclaceae bacterium]
MPVRPRLTTALPRHLAIAYGLLVIYACLNPFSGWRETGLPLFDFLAAPWPHYYRGIDLILNVLGFLPLGFVMVPAMPSRLSRSTCVLLTVVLCAMLSLSLETVQNFLPTRVPSNVDLGCNTLGALLGALAGAYIGHDLFDRRGWLHRWRMRRILHGNLGDAGLMLLGLWLFTQLSPESLLFGSGDLRSLLALPTPLSFSAPQFLRLETSITASHLVAVGLLARSMMREPSPWSIATLIVLGLATKTLAASSFFVPGQPLNWLTPGASVGLVAGIPILGLALLLPRAGVQVLAGLALLIATVLANLAPDNPYLQANVPLLNQGHFLNFHGATVLVSSLWPFLALVYLGLLGSLRSAGPRR